MGVLKFSMMPFMYVDWNAIFIMHVSGVVSMEDEGIERM